MRKKALWKNILNGIRNNKVRFIALLAIITLGVGFYSGISATGPDMLDTANSYYQKTNLFDLKVLSTYGIKDDDLNALEEIEDVIFEPIRTIDLVIQKEEFLVRLYPYATNQEQINHYDIVEGRLPTQSGEIALDAIPNLAEAYEIGDEIQFNHPETTEEEAVALKEQTYTVVGFVNSPLYIEQLSRGNSTVGKGQLDGFGVVKTEDLSGDIYTEMYATFETEEAMAAYTDNYRDYVEEKVDEVELALNGRPLERINEIRAEGRKEIFDGQNELAEAREQLVSAEQELADARKELDAAIAAYNANKSTYDAEIAAAEEEIATQQAAIDQGWLDYEAGLAEWEAGAQQYADAKATWERQRVTLLEQANKAVSLEVMAANPIPTPEGQKLAEEIQYLLNGEEDLQRAHVQLENHMRTLQEQERLLAEEQDKLLADKETATALQAQMEAEQAELTEKETTLELRRMQLTDITSYLATPSEALAEKIRMQGDVTLLFQPFMQFLNEEGDQTAVPLQQEQDVQANLTNEVAQQKASIQSFQTNLEALQIETRQTALLEQGTILERAKSLYNTNVADLDAKEIELQQARNIMLNEIQAAMRDIEAQVAAADQQFEQQGSSLESSRAELEAARSNLQAGQLQLDRGKAELASQREAGDAALADAWEQIQAGETEYAEGLQQFESERADAQKEIEDGETKLNKAMTELTQLDEPVYFVQTRAVNPGYEGYRDNAERISAIASIFPIFFFLIAALVSFTTMTRMVDEERQQMGTLKGLGYSNSDIAMKFLVYAAIACFGGTVIGLLAGYNLFPSIIYNAYSSLYNLPDVEINYYLSYGAIALAVSLLCTLGPAALATHRSLRENPASLMRPKAPKSGKRVLLERMPFIWNKLGFNSKITIRNLVRYKARNAMTVIGVAGCVALILTGYALKDSISGLADTQFNEVMVYDSVVAFQPDRHAADLSEYETLLADYPEITNHLFVYQNNFKAQKTGMSTQDVTIMVPENTEAIPEFIRLQERGGSTPIELADEGAVVSEKLALLLEAEPGDDITLRDDEQVTYTIPIAAVTENYTGHYVYLTPALYEDTFAERFWPNSDLLTFASAGDWQNTFADDAMQSSHVALVTFMDDIDRAFADTLESLDIITLVLIISAAALAFVVLYNLTNINVSERIRELSTIKVLGFYNHEVSMYIYRETLILTIMGIMIGFGLGSGLATLLLKMVEVDFMLFPITILPSSYLYSALLTMLFSVIIMLIMHVKLKKVDMIEALKSVE